MSETINLVYGHRAKSSEAALKLALKPGELGLNTEDKSVWVKDYNDGFIQIGGGAEVSLKTYNAVGDGLADDYDAIMAAYDATPAGGTLYIPPGGYRFATPLVFSKRINIRGAGILSCLIPDVGTIYDGISYGSGLFVSEWKDFCILATGNVRDNLSLTGIFQGTFSNIHVRGASRYEVGLAGCLISKMDFRVSGNYSYPYAANSNNIEGMIRIFTRASVPGVGNVATNATVFDCVLEGGQYTPTRILKCQMDSSDYVDPEFNDIDQLRTVSGTHGWTGKLVAYDKANKIWFISCNEDGLFTIGETLTFDDGSDTTGVINSQDEFYSYRLLFDSADYVAPTMPSVATPDPASPDMGKEVTGGTSAETGYLLYTNPDQLTWVIACARDAEFTGGETVTVNSHGTGALKSTKFQDRTANFYQENQSGEGDNTIIGTMEGARYGRAIEVYNSANGNIRNIHTEAKGDTYLYGCRGWSVGPGGSMVASVVELEGCFGSSVDGVELSFLIIDVTSDFTKIGMVNYNGGRLKNRSNSTIQISGSRQAAQGARSEAGYMPSSAINMVPNWDMRRWDTTLPSYPIPDGFGIVGNTGTPGDPGVATYTKVGIGLGDTTQHIAPYAVKIRTGSANLGIGYSWDPADLDVHADISDYWVTAGVWVKDLDTGDSVRLSFVEGGSGDIIATTSEDSFDDWTLLTFSVDLRGVDAGNFRVFASGIGSFYVSNFFIIPGIGAAHPYAPSNNSAYKCFYIDGHKIAFGLVVPPVSGQWETGDIVFASDPLSGDPAFGQCTAGGTPGTWETTSLGALTTTLTGDVTGSGSGSFSTTIAAKAVTLSKMDDMATASLLGRNTAGTGAPEVLSASTSRSLLGLVAIATSGSASDLSTGTVPAARMPALTGDVTTSAGAVATTIGANKIVTSMILDSNVTLAKIANIADQTILGNNTGGSAAPIALTATQTKTVLSLNNVENTALSTWVGTTNITTAGNLNVSSFSVNTNKAIIANSSGNTTLAGTLALGVTTGAAVRTMDVYKASSDSTIRVNSDTGRYSQIEITENASTTSGQYWQFYKYPSNDGTKPHAFELWNGASRMVITAGGAVTIPGTLAVTGGFGCNTKTPQTAYASGGNLSAYGAGANGFDTAGHAQEIHDRLDNVVTALKNCGIMS